MSDYWAHKHMALIKALRNWPKLPEARALKSLGSSSPQEFHSQDSIAGKKMQRELGLDIVPPVAECEWGAGLWDRITEGKWRECIGKGVDKTRNLSKIEDRNGAGGSVSSPPSGAAALD